MMFQRIALSLTVLLATCALARAQSPADVPTYPARHIFVLHDGLHTILSDPIPTWATRILRYYLVKQGVPDRDIIVMEFPFPIASRQDMFPPGALTYYLDSMRPDSDASRQAYLRLDRALADRGIRPQDKLVWIGHSAGGQVGMTMAHLGSCLPLYPDLARQAAPHPFDMVVTLGSPLGVDLVPTSVKQRHYFSPRDIVVELTCDFGHLALTGLGHDVHIVPTPPRLGSNTIVRIFDGYTHASWPAESIVARILAEYREVRPAWRSLALSPGAGPSLANLLSEALDEQYRLSIEDPFE